MREREEGREGERRRKGGREKEGEGREGERRGEGGREGGRLKRADLHGFCETRSLSNYVAIVTHLPALMEVIRVQPNTPPVHACQITWLVICTTIWWFGSGTGC